MQTSENHAPVQASSDADLLSRYAVNADDAAFAELVRRYLPLVHAVTRRRLGGSGLAEDAAQQVFIALSRKIQTARKVPCIAAWLQKAAVYEAANLARSEKRHRKRTQDATGLAGSGGAEAAGRVMDEALAAIPEKDREVLLLHYFEKLPYERIATRLGISMAAAQRRGHRAMERLASRVKEAGRDENACAMWLGSGFAAGAGKAPSELATKIIAAKKSAGGVFPWMPVVAAIALGGGGTFAVMNAEVERQQPETTSVTAGSGRERLMTQPFNPRVLDEQLREEVREFISRARIDSRDAWEWVKQQPEGSHEFIQEAVGHLVDRDPGAADRFLDVVEGREPRWVTIGEILDSRSEMSVESAVLWIDGLPSADDRRAINFSTGWYSSDEIHDCASLLGLARTKEVRMWLIGKACKQAALLDETQIEKLAAKLEGDERRLALGQAASLLFQRGDVRAFELFDEVRPTVDMLGDLDAIALSDPRGFLEWVRRQTDGEDRGSASFGVWDSWGRRNAGAAAEWADSLSDAERQRMQLLYSHVPAVRRLSKTR